MLWDLQVKICFHKVFMNKINYVTAAAMSCVVVMYLWFLNCLGFHIFRLLHAMNCICCILPNFIASIECCEMKLSWTVLHNSLVLTQCTEALPFLQNILVEVINHLSLEMCICTHSLVVDQIGCSICVYQSHIAIFCYRAVFNAHLTV